jgi:Tol biopolymer transport system component
VAPDGRSLITTTFTQQNTVWIHDAHGDRALSTEGYAEATPPVFSRDGKRLYYLLHRESPESPAELWRSDLTSGKSEAVLPGVSIRGYGISEDEKDVVFATQPAGQSSQLWIAPLDHSAPPRRIASDGATDPSFGPNDEVFFRLTDGRAFYLGAVKRDGTGQRQVLPDRILSYSKISPNRRFVLIDSAVLGSPHETDPNAYIISLDGGAPRRLCDGECAVNWSPDGRYFYVQIAQASRGAPTGKTVAIRLPPGQTFPPFPPDAVQHVSEWAKAPGAKIVEHSNITPGLTPSTYAYIKAEVHANLFRIPLR